MKIKELKKEIETIGGAKIQELADFMDFLENSYNFRLPEEELEKVWEITQDFVYNALDRSNTYNTDTVSYALMAFLEENDINELLEQQKEDEFYEWIIKQVNIYNDLETEYEIY